MARTKADYESLMVQEFLSKAQAMAYTNTTEDEFKKWIAPYCHVYRSKHRSGDYYLPELRRRKLDLVEVEPTQYTT